MANNTTFSNETKLISLPTDFSGLAVDGFKDQFEEVAHGKQQSVVLDFTSTTFIDSSGIGAMVFLYKRIEKKGQKLSLLNVSGQPHKLMSLLRVDKTIPFIEQADIA
ncbi:MULTISPECIES: STAS domain-containing protein [Pseudoalteromonas]|jgi:anti-anti-sigma factor|uniref:Anti-sigma factor antagonist n=1 Tax=Pseudoalteromonas gelatinilytica TaxID=1703256 RepID=A0A3A3EME4_9GAMM|nr:MULTISPECIES: STAS domain-containing protein [Pseudoalteromonas]RJF36846.1 anti-sigma factor antagonist [Pseudoalteromonas profundi]TMO25082.1 anti-sigma factor antagonist [Pseudoalteromonas sp. S4492]